MNNRPKKVFMICFASVTLLIVPNIVSANQAAKEQIEFNKLFGSEKVNQSDELFLLMQKTFIQIEKEYQEMVTEVEALVENGQPVKRMGNWYLEKKTDVYQINVICKQRPGLAPVATSKRYFYKDVPSGQKIEAFSLNLSFHDEYVLFGTSYGAGLLLSQGVLEDYYFELNENRTYETHFEKGNLKRSIISKARRPKEEKEPKYELYFPDQNDLDIVKNKLLNHLIKLSYIARTKEASDFKDISNRTISKIDYDITFGKDRMISRFFRKSTGEEITFHSNGKVKNFSVTGLGDDKKLKAEWDSDGNLIKTEISKE